MIADDAVDGCGRHTRDTERKTHRLWPKPRGRTIFQFDSTWFDRFISNNTVKLRLSKASINESIKLFEQLGQQLIKDQEIIFWQKKKKKKRKKKETVTFSFESFFYPFNRNRTCIPTYIS